MKTRFSLFGFIAILLLGIGMYFASCNNNDTNGVVTYKGHVVYLKTTTPFPDLEVKVTNGDKIHVLTHTDASGDFSLKVKVSEIDGSYYVLVGDSTCVTKKVDLSGYGQAEVDLGTIEVEGPSAPVVETKPVLSVSADGAVCGGEVKSDGRLTVAARGVCYSKNAYPTITDECTKDGTGLGEFTSNLSNLEHNTIYYVRAYATNRMGVSYGEQVKFTTEEGVPIVVTDSVIRITAHSARCKGHVESDGGFAVSKRGTCWSKRPDPTIDDDCTDDGSGLGEFTSAMNNLIENTQYYVRTYATNSTGTVYGEQVIITTLDGLAVVTTDSITSVTATGCTAYGTVVSDCDIPVTTRGFCYATTQYPTIENDHTTIGKGLGKFQSTISNLEYGTTYYVRAYAINATETSYGEQFTITTLDGLPTVTTNQVTNIGSVKATCGGNVISDGSLTVTARGVCYGTTQQPTISGSHTTDGKGLGAFTSNITGLQDKTTYYVRAYATTAAGTSYGEERTFVTANGTPVVVLSPLGTPTATSITCTGNVTGDGGVTVTERGFCYSTSQYPVNTGSHVAIGTGTGEFSGSITGLTINTTYYVRAYAVNSLGVGYSEQQSFTTPNGLPVVATGQATATATTISISGNVTSNGGFAVSERGICYSNANSEPTITDNKVISGQGNGSFNLTISSLSAAITYYLRAYATNENGTAYGDAVSVTTANGQASVTTGTISSITALTASGKVTVTNAGGATLQTCGICWSTSPNPTITDNTAIGGNQLNTAYTCNMSDLAPNTTYYVRGYATTDITTTYGSQVTFQTATGLPELTTSQPTSTATTITAGGEITSNGGYAVTERGICYSTTNSEPTILDSKVSCGSGNGSFNATISPLPPSTNYYVRAYATNSIGTGYGNAITAITMDGIAVVTTGAINNITTISGTSSVTVSNNGGATLNTCGICWSTIHNPTIENNTATGGNQLNTAYTCNMTELIPNTKYYVRAYATTSITTSYGNEVSFTTLTEVTGIVRGESGLSIPNATIKFKQGSGTIKTVTSNANGGFSVQLSAGTYNIEVTANGYTNYQGVVNVDSNPIEIIMRELGTLSGVVYDDDNIPLANATIKVKSSINNTTLSATSNSDGTYRIENIPLGQTSSITCSLSGYQITSTIPNMNINSGNNSLDIQMQIVTPFSRSSTYVSFLCSSDGQCGTTATKTFQITNNRQKAVTWSLSGVPSRGVVFSPNSGSIAAKSSAMVTVTFTYPGPSVSGSVRTTLYGCSINNKTPYTYLWNWARSEPYSLNQCAMYSSQDITIIIGNNTCNFSVDFNQEVIWIP